MKKYTVNSLAKKIEKDNEKFNQATNAEKRVIIAEDCLTRVMLGQILPESGNFCSFRNIPEPNIKQTLDTTKKLVCCACAKGSLFMAYLGRVNNFYVEQMTDINNPEAEPHLKLLEIFDITQLALIEFAFEGILYLERDNDLEYTHFDSICYFRKKVAQENNIEIYKETFIDYCHEIQFVHEKDSERFEAFLLKAICENIIFNDGNFVI